MERFKNFMNETFTFSGREVALGLACCALAGVVLGMLMVPPKDISIGCNNNIVGGDADDEQEEAEEAAEEE
jgi:hypothetical protein